MTPDWNDDLRHVDFDDALSVLFTQWADRQDAIAIRCCAGFVTRGCAGGVEHHLMPDAWVVLLREMADDLEAAAAPAARPCSEPGVAA